MLKQYLSKVHKVTSSEKEILGNALLELNLWGFGRRFIKISNLPPQRYPILFIELLSFHVYKCLEKNYAPSPQEKSYRN